MAKKLYVRNNENTEWVEVASSIQDISNYLTINSASLTYATKTELNNIDLSSASAAAVAAIIDSAPSTLNTLNELAAALGDDANFASTITTALGDKLNISTASSTYATILDPVFTNNVQIEGDLKFDVVDGTEKGLIRVLSGPGYNQLQVYTPEQLNLYSEGYAGIYSDDNVIIGGTNGEFLNSSGSANQIATIGNLNEKASTGKAIAMAVVFGS